MAQAFVQRKSRLRVKGIRVKDREKIKEAIAISIQNGNFAHGEGKRYGLSTTPGRLGEYKEIMLTPEQITIINKLLENERGWESWSFL
ncbi:hypothetical protein [Nitrososphaera sp.]|uniref:hypothetical protein n=1 Tax=Nitrososphaera sp. TaxID=1971748 RepID=UPI00307E0D89